MLYRKTNASRKAVIIDITRTEKALFFLSCKKVIIAIRTNTIVKVKYKIALLNKILMRIFRPFIALCNVNIASITKNIISKRFSHIVLFFMFSFFDT